MSVLVLARPPAGSVAPAERGSSGHGAVGTGAKDEPRRRAVSTSGDYTDMAQVGQKDANPRACRDIRRFGRTSVLGPAGVRTA